MAEKKEKTTRGPGKIKRLPEGQGRSKTISVCVSEVKRKLISELTAEYNQYVEKNDPLAEAAHTQGEALYALFLIGAAALGLSSAPKHLKEKYCQVANNGDAA